MLKTNSIIRTLALITIILLYIFSTSCKKEEERELIILNEFSKKFLPKYDTLYFKFHHDTRRYKLAIDVYYYEEVVLETNSTHHKLTTIVEHYYKKFTSTTHHLIYHLYVNASQGGHCDVMKITIVNKVSERSYEIPFTLYQNNMESEFPLLQKSENISVGEPLIDSTYYINYDNYNYFFLEYHSLLNYTFEDKIWLYILE